MSALSKELKPNLYIDDAGNLRARGTVTKAQRAYVQENRANLYEQARAARIAAANSDDMLLVDILLADNWPADLVPLLCWLYTAEMPVGKYIVGDREMDFTLSFYEQLDRLLSRGANSNYVRSGQAAKDIQDLKDAQPIVEKVKDRIKSRSNRSF